MASDDSMSMAEEESELDLQQSCGHCFKNSGQSGGVFHHVHISGGGFTGCRNRDRFKGMSVTPEPEWSLLLNVDEGFRRRE
jgi:hypothetical protein